MIRCQPDIVMMGQQGPWLLLVLLSVMWITPTPASATRLTFNVSTKTGTRDYAGTGATMFLKIFGETGNTEELPLSKSQAVSCNDNIFKKGQTDVFILEATDVGEIDRITLRRDGSDWWFVDRVDILVATLSKRYQFTVNKWVAVTHLQVNTTSVDACFGSYWQETFRLTSASHVDYLCGRDQESCSNDSFAVLTQSETESMAHCRCNESNFVGFFFRAHPDQLISHGWDFNVNAAVRKVFGGASDNDYSLTCWPNGTHACVGDYHLCKMTCGAPSGASGSVHHPILCSNRSPSTWVCDSPSLTTTAATSDATTASTDSTGAATAFADAATSTDAATFNDAVSSAELATSTGTTTPDEMMSADVTTSAEARTSTEATATPDSTRSPDEATSALVTASTDSKSYPNASFVMITTTAAGSFDSPTATAASTTSKPQTSTSSRTPSSSPSDSMSATPTRSPAISRDRACGRCTCQFPRQFRQNLALVFGNQTMGEIMSQLSEGLKKELTLNKYLLSSTNNKNVSKPDYRLSSTSIGYLGIAIFSGLLILILLSDLAHFRQLCRKRNKVNIESQFE